MAELLKLEIVTPDGKAYSEDVEMVTLTGVDGEMGILPHHVRLMTEMLAGELVAHKDGQDHFLAVGAGLVEVTATPVSILPELAGGAGSLAGAPGGGGR